MEFQLNINSRASDLLAQFHRQFLRSPDNGKGKMRRYELQQCSNLDTLFLTSLDFYMCRNGSVVYPDCALYEVGGNIGEFFFLVVHQCWHLHVFLLTEQMRVSRSYVMKCAGTKETWACASAVIRADKCLLHTCLCPHMREKTSCENFSVQPSDGKSHTRCDVMWYL